MRLNRLRELREERNLSQRALAEMVSTSQQNIYKYENGITEPDIQMLKALADVFHVSVDFLVEHETARLEGVPVSMKGDGVSTDKSKEIDEGFEMDFEIQSSHQVKRLSSDLIHLLVSYERCRPEVRGHLLSITDELSKRSGDAATDVADEDAAVGY